MFDAGALPYDENVARTAQRPRASRMTPVCGSRPSSAMSAASRMHRAARTTTGVRTDPDEADAFVRGTGVDALAVAVGSSHAMTTQTRAPRHRADRAAARAARRAARAARLVRRTGRPTSARRCSPGSRRSTSALRSTSR